MQRLEQLMLTLVAPRREVSHRDVTAATAGLAHRLPSSEKATGAAALQPRSGRAPELEVIAKSLLDSLGASRLAARLQVEWNSRLRTCAGRADFRHGLVMLNPKLHDHGDLEIDRTLRHELAHLLAHDRCGRRRIAPHGAEWRRACRDLGIVDEARCHTLPFVKSRPARRFLYRCPHCRRDFPRVRRIKRGVACLACCRAHNRGKFDAKFRLHLVCSNRTAAGSHVA